MTDPKLEAYEAEVAEIRKLFLEYAEAMVKSRPSLQVAQEAMEKLFDKTASPLLRGMIRMRLDFEDMCKALEKKAAELDAKGLELKRRLDELDEGEGWKQGGKAP